jgi:formylglycine-generating enzyme required for sulfatase activity
LHVGDYVIEGKLGKGAVGAVYEVRHVPTGEVRALKAIPTPTREQRERFKREAFAQAAGGAHPNVARCFEVGEYEERHVYLVIEHLPGGSLQDRIDRRGPLPPVEAARTLASVARGLGVIHALGVLHRDLKPENVMFAADGTAKLVDFGIVRLLDADSLTETGALVGTPAFMAPEQAIGDKQRLGPSTDVYGLGATLYCALTGALPVDGDSIARLLRQITQDDPRPPSALAPQVPPELDRIVLKAMARAPGDRYASAAELADALDGWVQGERKSALPRAVLIPVGVALLLLAGAAFGSLFATPPAAEGGAIAPPAPAEPPAPEPRRPGPRSLPSGLVQSGEAFINAKDGSLLVLIPPGSFVQGDPKGITRSVTLSRGFFLGKHEVTWNQWAQFCRETGRPLLPPRQIPRCVTATGERIRLKKPFDPSRVPRHPATFMYYADARAYCEWAGGRLPSEAQWEYAARGTDGRTFPWGDDAGGLARANVAGRLVGTLPVDLELEDPGPFGSLNLGGNVAEWVEDVEVSYAELNRLKAPTTDPVITYELFSTLRTVAGLGLKDEDLFQRGRCLSRGGDFRSPPAEARAFVRTSRTARPEDLGLGLRLCIPGPE